MKYNISYPTPSGRLQLRDYLVAFMSVLVLAKTLQSFIHRLIKKRSEQICAATGGNEEVHKVLNSLPGPWSFPWRLIGSGWVFLTKTDVIETLQKLFHKYGPCYRLTVFNEDYIVLNTAPMVQTLLMSNDTGHFGRAPFEEMIFPKGVKTILLLTDDEWKSRRKMLNRSFTYKSLKKYNDSFNQYSDKLIDGLTERFHDRKVHDIDDLVKLCIVRQSSDTLMGVDLSSTEDGERFCKSIEIAIKTTFDRVYRPWLYPEWIWRLHPLSRQNRQALETSGSITLKIINNYAEKQRKKEMNDCSPENYSKGADEDNDHECNSMIEVMLRGGVPSKEIFHEVAVMLAVAHDTTSVSVIYALFLLAVNPEHRKLCQNEIDAVFDDPEKCKSGTLEYEAFSELKYLERCILEAQRIYPLATTMRKLKTPLRISDDLVLPPGVSACFLSNVLHMNPEYFPDPEKFDPDRFLPENVRTRHPCSFVPFSAGPRNCLGMKLAMIELKIIIAKILRNFDVSTPETRQTLKTVFIGISKPAKPIDFLFTRRKLE